MAILGKLHNHHQMTAVGLIVISIV